MSRQTPRRSTALRLDALESREVPAGDFLAFGAAAGGRPLVAVLRPDGSLLAQFDAFEPGFRGGVRAAAGELDGDPNTLHVIAAAGPGGGPRVRVVEIDLATAAITDVADAFFFEPTFTGGVRVAVGNVANVPGRQQVIVAPDIGGGPRIRTFALEGNTLQSIAGPLGDFFAFEPQARGGVRVAAGELDGNLADGDELVVAAGPTGGPRVRVIRSDGAVLADFFAFRSDFRGGVQVGVEETDALGRLRLDAFTEDFSQRNAAVNAAAGVVTLDGTAGQPVGALGSGTVAGTTGTGAFGLGGTTGVGTGAFDTGGFGSNTFNEPPFGTGLGSTFGQTTFGTPGTFGTTSTGFGTGPFGTGGSFGSGVGRTFGQAQFATGSAFGLFIPPTGVGGTAGAGSAFGTSFATTGAGTLGGSAGTSSILDSPFLRTATDFDGTFGTDLNGFVNRFGPFGDPGAASPVPVLANIPFIPGVVVIGNSVFVG